MLNTIIWVEVLAILVNCVVLYGNMFETRLCTGKRRFFSYYVLATMLGETADLISWIFEGQEKYTVLLTTSTLISFVTVFPATALFVYYMYEHISSKQKTPRMPFEFCAMGMMFLLLVVTVDCLCGGMFIFRNGVYDTGPHYGAYLLSEAVVYLVIVWIAIRFRAVLGLHDIIATLSYLVFPLGAMIANAFAPEYSFGYPACTLSVLLIYVMLEGDQERGYLQRERDITDESRRDELTGLLNRRAFTEMCDHQTGEETIGVVFCDANGLKYANDHFGHERGDRLLCDVAYMLRSCFHHESTFRISGDEFVVLVPDAEQEAFDKRVGELNDRMKACPVPMAAIGSAFGSKAQLTRLIAMAEENMYQDKQAFYVRFPAYKRQ